MEHALRRNANILAEMVGYGMSSDAYHYTLPEPSGMERIEQCIIIK